MNERKCLNMPMVLFLVLTLVLAACQPSATPISEATSTLISQTQPTSEPTKEPTAKPTATSPKPTLEPTATETVPTPGPAAWKERPNIQSDYQGELVLWDWSYEPRNNWVEKYISEWEQLHPGVTIKYEIMPESDVGSKLSTAIVAGTGPDFSVVNEEWRVEFQRNGLLEPLPKDIFPQEWRDLLYSTPYLTDKNGDIYVTSIGAMGAVLYWDKKVFAEAGLTEDDIPKTWDQLVELAQSLTTWNDDGTLNRAGFGVNGLPMWLWFDLVVQKGGHFYNQDVTKALWNEQPGIEAAQFIQDLFLKYKVTSPKVPWWGDLYCNGRVAIGYNYAWMPGWVSSNCPEKSEDLGIAPLPTFDGAPAQGLQLEEDFIATFKNTTPEKKALIWDFLHFLLLEDDERLLDLAEGFAVPPDRKDLADSSRILDDPMLRVGSDAAPFSVRPGPLPMFGDHAKFLNTAFEEILLQGTPVKESLDRAVEQANLDLKSSGKIYDTSEWEYVPPSQ